MPTLLAPPRLPAPSRTGFARALTTPRAPALRASCSAAPRARPPGATPSELTGGAIKRPQRQLSDPTRPARTLSARGQASVELVVLLPVILVVLAVGYQAVLAGQAIWEVRVAARAAARANALGADAAAAARAHLPE